MHDTAHISDAGLLADYVKRGDERAFAALVDLHERMVIGTAWRRTGDAELARDIAQEVFATLARKAAWLTDRKSIAGWLYTTTIHLASRVRRSEAARRLREKRFTAEAECRSNEYPWHLLEDALRELTSVDREAVVLHFLEDRSYEEMARTLGLSEVAARKRVSRELKSLGVRLLRRGFTSAAASLLSGAVAAQGSVPVTVSTQAALSLAASGGASSTFLALSTMMSHTTTKLAAAAALVLATPITWQAHANADRRAEIAGLQAANTRLAAVQSRSNPGEIAAMRRELDTATSRLNEAQSARKTAEGDLASLQQQFDRIQQEVLVSFGKSEDFARQVAAKVGPLIKFESIRDELKKNPKDPRLNQIVNEMAQTMPGLFALGTQIALLEDNPVQYARFNSVLYGEMLGLDATTREKLETIFLPAFETLRREGLAIRSKPQQNTKDWLRRRAEFEQSLWRDLKTALPPNARAHPLLAGKGNPPVLFTSEEGFGSVFPRVPEGRPASSAEDSSNPAPKQPQP
jgi:RNA polymerase sigma factor (sigma-70 family)